MKTVAAFCCALLLLVAMGGEALAQKRSPKPQPPDGQPPTAAAQRDKLMVGDPIGWKNLTIFPVSSKDLKDEDRYITLDEGLQAKTIEVSETGAIARQAGGRGNSQRANARQGDSVEGDVNRLWIINRSGKPLYLMPGEIIVGGKQDRTLAKEMIIAPDGKPVELEVFCVEHGRWSGRNRAETVAVLQAVAGTPGQPVDRETLQAMSGEANQGKFVAGGGSLNKSSRRVVQEGKGQGEVWDAVGEVNEKSGAKTRSGAFTANYADRDVVQRFQAYLDQLQAPVTRQRQVVGVIVAINGKVEAADVFGSTPLFLKFWPKLLKSYALDAATESGKDQKACTVADAQAFLDKAMKAEVKQEAAGPGGLTVTHRDSKEVVSFSAKAADKAAAQPSAGFGGSVHSSAYSK